MAENEEKSDDSSHYYGSISERKVRKALDDTTKDINRITAAIIKVSLYLILYALLILVIYEGMRSGFAFGYEIFGSTAMSSSPGTVQTVVITDGQSDNQVAKLLKNRSLIRNEYAFIVQARLYEYTIYPGTYELNTAMTSREILDKLSEKPKEGK